MRSKLILAFVLTGCAAGLAWAAGPGGNGGGGGTALTPAEEQGLLFMREEEKLARDVYQYFDGLYDLPIFANIASSEQRHMDSVLTLLDRYELEDPAAGKEPGEFTNEALQTFYDQLIAQGSASLEAALGAGVLIEQTDIQDLEASLLSVAHNDIRRVYENLLRGSQNHLAAFQSNLDGSADGTVKATKRGTGRQRGRACRVSGQTSRRSGRACRVSGRGNCVSGRANGRCASQRGTGHRHRGGRSAGSRGAMNRR